MSRPKRVLEALWRNAPVAAGRFDAGSTIGLPEAAARYLQAAIAPDAPLAQAVRLRMHGEIRLKGWCPFRAEQVIRRDGGMIWWARVRMGGLPVLGYDSLLDGAGTLDWRLLNLIPVMRRTGPDITRSAIGRVLGERVWLPTALLPPEVSWAVAGDHAVTATMTALGERLPLTIEVGDDGAPKAFSFPRWGDPDGAGFRWARFGGQVEEMARFGPFWIPSRVCVGWLGDEPSSGEEGAFFRCRVEDASYR